MKIRTAKLFYIMLFALLSGLNVIGYADAIRKETVLVSSNHTNADLDVDSDNNNGFDEPTRSPEEDQNENVKGDPNNPGKLIIVNDGDVDGDGVPNFADGFDKYGNEGADAGGRFTPLILEIREPIDLSTARIKFIYSDSDPNGVVPKNVPANNDPIIYVPAEGGNLRIWTVDGSESRKKAEFGSNGGGHFVKSGSEYKLSDFDFDSNRKVDLFVEGIKESEKIADQKITVQLAYDDSGKFGDADAVRVTLLNVDLEIFDENGNPQTVTDDNPFNIPVNGDFDEEKKVDGRYVRDYEDVNLFKGSSVNAMIQTDDLRGCVVDIPDLGDSVWQNITLKIRKKSGVIDPETDEQEAGEIRIHAIDAEGNGVEVPLDADLVSDFYLSTGQYANYDSCWVEGIKDGPMTIELEVIINGGAPILVEKKAMICTEKTKAEWLQELRDEIQILRDVDISKFIPINGFDKNKKYIQAVYFYYEEMYFREQAGYQWPGLAKLAGAPVYAGLLDADRLDILAFITFTSDDARLMQKTLMEMNLAVYSDMAWQFKVYHTSGLCALEHLNETDFGSVSIEAWRKIASGIENNNQSDINEGNIMILRREQEQALAEGYSTLENLNLISFVMSWLAENPVPGGQDFHPNLLSDGTRLYNFTDRWNWIMRDPGGIWTEWARASDSQKQMWVDIPLLERMQPYSYTSNF